MKWYFAAGSKASVDLLLDCGVKSILTSYAYFKKGLPDRLIRECKNGKVNIMLDSGAYTNYAKPGHVKFNEYIEYLKSYHKSITEYVVLDSLKDRNITLSNYEKMMNLGLNPIFVDHLWYKWGDMIDPRYKEGKICWAGFPWGDRSGYWNKHGTQKFYTRLEERLNKARDKPLSTVHLLGVGWRLKKFAAVLDVIDSFDTASWAINAGGFGKVFWMGEADEMGWPKLKAVHHSEVPKDVANQLRDRGFKLDKYDDRNKIAILAFKKYFNAVEQRFKKAKDSNEDLSQAVRKDMEEEWIHDIIELAVETRDGVQVWDPDKRDADADRSQLRPLALFQPMKPSDRPTNDFGNIEDALQHFATPGSLAVGVAVEPKWNGFRVVVEKKDDRVLIYTEDKWRDMSHLLPSVTKEVKSIDGDFILDAELLALENNKPLPRRDLARFRGKEPVDDSGVRLRVFHALWLPKDGNITAVHYDDMRKQLSAWFKGKRLKHLEESPYKVARNGKQLRDLMVTWAAKQPGSEGAMLKQLTSTYTLGGQSSSWAKWKLTRLIRAIVYDRHPVKGSLGVFNFFCAVGPVSKPEEWKETVEVNGKTYTVIGKTGNAKIAAKKGDTIVAEIFELLHEAEPDEKKRLHWFGPPMVVSKTNQGPMRIEEVTDLLEEWEVKKQLDIEKVHRVRFLPETIQKAKNDERYVLGIVLEPEVADAQGDIYSADEIKQACHKYMAKWRNRGFMHRVPVNDSVDLVENIFVHPEMVLTVGGTAIKKGSWLSGFHLHDDEYWNKTKRGEITGLSIGGTAEKEPVK